MKTETIKVKMTFTEPLLGSASGDKSITENFIASKAPTQTNCEEEVKAVSMAESIEKAMTIFPRDEKGLFWWDYQIRGAIKEGIGALIELGDCAISKWQYKRAVDQFVFVDDRKNYLVNAQTGQPWTSAPSTLQRPQRCDTMQGPRVSLAISEQLPPGTFIQFTVECLIGDGKTKIARIDRELIARVLDYICKRGNGQWRSGGYGRATWNEMT